MLLAADPSIRALSNYKSSYSLEATYRLLEKCGGVTINLENKSSPRTFHDAGYDAYITGYCFAKMLHYLPLYILDRYRNRLYSHNSIYIINLQGEDDLPSDVKYWKS